jgi:uncharacterized heparinase superfamily protein
VNREGPTLIAEAGHDGYSDLPGRPIHRRHWHFSPLTLTIVDEIGVVDEIVAGKKIDAEAHFHLHPDIEIQQLSAREGTLNLPGGQKVRWHCERGEVRVGPTTWHPEFGLSIKSSYLIITSDDGCCKLNVHWS